MLIVEVGLFYDQVAELESLKELPHSNECRFRFRPRFTSLRDTYPAPFLKSGENHFLMYFSREHSFCKLVRGISFNISLDALLQVHLKT